MSLKAFLRGRPIVRDDLGIVREVQVWGWPSMPAWNAPRSCQTLRRVRTLCIGSRLEWGLIYIGVSAAVTIVLTCSGITFAPTITTNKAIATLATVSVYGTGALSALLICYWRVRRRLSIAVGLMKERCLCAACAYDLRSIPADPETHLTTCPECGAAWNLSPGGTALQSGE